jgi:hypothetical protein
LYLQVVKKSCLTPVNNVSDVSVSIGCRPAAKDADDRMNHGVAGLLPGAVRIHFTFREQTGKLPDKTGQDQI